MIELEQVSKEYNKKELLAAASFAGSGAGSFLHKRILKDRKAAIVLTLLAVLFAVVKGPVIGKIPAFKLIAWVFPPVSEFISLFVKTEYFTLAKTAYGFLMLFFYGAVVYGIKILLLKRIKF